MRFHTPLVLGGLALAGVIACGGWALSQVNVTAGLFGNEAIVVAQTGPGGPSIFTTAGRLSSGNSYAYFTAFPASFTIGNVSGTVNTAGVANGGVLAINAANTAQTFTLPATGLLIDGEIVGICNVTAAAWATNAVTVAANTNQTLVGSGTLTTLGASTCAKFLWNGPVLTWFRVQ